MCAARPVVGDATFGASRGIRRAGAARVPHSAGAPPLQSPGPRHQVRAQCMRYVPGCNFEARRWRIPRKARLRDARHEGFGCGCHGGELAHGPGVPLRRVQTRVAGDRNAHSRRDGGPGLARALGRHGAHAVHRGGRHCGNVVPAAAFRPRRQRHREVGDVLRRWCSSCKAQGGGGCRGQLRPARRLGRQRPRPRQARDGSHGRRARIPRGAAPGVHSRGYRAARRGGTGADARADVTRQRACSDRVR
mmetsp:Transcript_20262/g.77787  ORF Transcript_20262/g.77787 Transcript_20262/m.77787 type:complete len:248 (-) Transcript_20262:756-1499(-)